MKTIVKDHDIEANAIIDPYLAWAQTQRWYGEECGRKLYERLRLCVATGDNNRRKIVEDVLLPEQQHRCCYCMRRIDDHTDSASVEHIVPESTDTNVKLRHYFSPRSAGLNAASVCLTPDYVRSGSVAPPYPHHVAYHNFAVACVECNSHRYHYEIEPIFLFEGIENEVTYDNHTGEMDWPNDPAYTNSMPELPTIEKVGLNRPLLKAIRAVWFYAKSRGIVPATANRNELVYKTVGESISAQPMMDENDFDAYLSLLKDEMWNLLLKYDYFGL